MVKQPNQNLFNKYIFFIAYIPWLVSWIFTSTYFKDTLHPYFIISVYNLLGIPILLIAFICRSKLNIVNIIVGLLVCGIGWRISFHNDNASFVFYTLVLLYLAADLQFKQLIELTFYIQIISLICIISSSLIGIIPNIVDSSYAGGFFRARYCLGFTFSTYAPNYFLSLVLEYLFLKKGKKLYFIELLIIIFIDIFIYSYTKTRLSFYMTLGALIFYYLAKKIRPSFFKKTIISFLIHYSYIIACVLSFTITLKCGTGGDWLEKLNLLLSERLRFGKLGLEQWGMSMFGKSVTWLTDPTTYNYIDSSYINIAVCYGWALLLIIVLTFSAILKKITNTNQVLAFVLVLWAIRAMIDPQLFLLWFNPFLFLIGKQLFGNNLEGELCTQ